MTEEKLKCCWSFGEEPHNDTVVTRKVFDGQLSAPMCELCWNTHKKITYLCDQKVNVEVLTRLSVPTREELYNTYEYINSDEYKEEQKIKLQERMGKMTEEENLEKFKKKQEAKK